MYIYIYTYIYMQHCCVCTRIHIIIHIIIHISVSFLILQPVPEKMRHEIFIEMQIEILNGGEILVNCKFKSNQNLNLDLYHEIQRNSNSIKISSRICTARYQGIWVYQFWLVDYNLPTIQDFVCISTSISSLIFSGTGCSVSHLIWVSVISCMQRHRLLLHTYIYHHTHQCLSSDVGVSYLITGNIAASARVYISSYILVHVIVHISVCHLTWVCLISSQTTLLRLHAYTCHHTY